MPLELNDRVTIRMTPREWSMVAIELLQGAVFETAAPLVGEIVASDGGAVTMIASAWNEILAILRNGRYAVVAEPIAKIVTQAQAAQMLIAQATQAQQTANGLAAGEEWPEHEVKAPSMPPNTPLRRGKASNAG